MFWLLALISYFVPLSNEYLLKTELQNPVRDRVYIQEIPFVPHRFLRFWEYKEIENCSGKITFSFIEDSLKSPKVLLYSIRGKGSSEVGGFLKTPIEKVENGAVLLYSNLKNVDSINSFLLLAFRHTGKVNLKAAFAQEGSKSGYAFSSSSFRNFYAFYKHGDFEEAEVAFKANNFSVHYGLDGKIHSAILDYKGISLGFSYCEKFYPYIDIKQTFDFITLKIEYATRNFYNRPENRLYGSIRAEKNGYFAGIEGKTGKEGVYYFEKDELKGGRFIAGITGGIQKDYLFLSFHYFKPSQGKFTLRLSPLFEFKKGEVALEPEVTIFYDRLSEKLYGKIGISLFLFRATETRFAFDFSKGAFFGIGVNLFD